MASNNQNKRGQGHRQSKPTVEHPTEPDVPAPLGEPAVAIFTQDDLISYLEKMCETGAQGQQQLRQYAATLSVYTLTHIQMGIKWLFESVQPVLENKAAFEQAQAALVELTGSPALPAPPEAVDIPAVKPAA